MRGQLADGTKFTYASALDSQNRFPFYVPLYKLKGAIAGPLAFQPPPTLPGFTSIDTTGLIWFRPPQLTPKPAPQYPNGWPDGIDLGFIGAGRNSVTEPNVLPTGLYTLTLSDSGVDPIILPQEFTILAKNRVTIDASNNARKVTVKIKPSGEWTGTFLHPVTNKKTTVQGVSVRAQESSGFFLSGLEAGSATIVPKIP
jgi:hypothetical protein